MKPNEQIGIIKAAAKGYPIQYRGEMGKWINCVYPKFFPNFDERVYRIDPERPWPCYDFNEIDPDILAAMKLGPMPNRAEPSELNFIAPQFAVTGNFLAQMMVEHLIHKHGPTGLWKVPAKIGFSLGFSHHWEQRNPDDAILARAANILAGEPAGPKAIVIGKPPCCP